MRHILIIIIVTIAVRLDSLEISRIDNIPRGNYVAKSLNQDNGGKTILEIYGKALKLFTSNRSSINVEEYSRKMKEFRYHPGIDIKLDYNKVELCIINFENGYSPNAYLGDDIIVIDGNCFK